MMTEAAFAHALGSSAADAVDTDATVEFRAKRAGSDAWPLTICRRFIAVALVLLTSSVLANTYDLSVANDLGPLTESRAHFESK